LYVTVPPASLDAPLKVAESVTDVPTSIVEDASRVEMVGEACVTVIVSPASPQPEDTGLLPESPLYAAVQRYVPAADGVKGAEVAAAELTGSESGPNTDTVHEPSE
jgi:hypothetical protein